ncbi:hypothetical protein [Actinokineospora sp. HUAS TT18]|uniref:hypothetical protein n=1 Tax=Actinokineospora sp. HUAS TT18 TaxID=3447451 RepID=UPI003F521E63
MTKAEALRPDGPARPEKLLLALLAEGGLGRRVLAATGSTPTCCAMRSSPESAPARG